MTLYGTVTHGSNSWSKFSDKLKLRYEAIQKVTTNKPLALLETAVTDYHSMGSKSEWLEDAFEAILNNEHLKFQAISYWNDEWEGASMGIDSSEETLTTFRQLISNPRFTSELRFSQ
jgi:hypothetical protein